MVAGKVDMRALAENERVVAHKGEARQRVWCSTSAAEMPLPQVVLHHALRCRAVCEPGSMAAK